MTLTIIPERRWFPIGVIDPAIGGHPTPVTVVKTVDNKTGIEVMLDQHGLAYVVPPNGSRLLHVRAEQYDVDPKTLDRSQPDPLSYIEGNGFFSAQVLSRDGTTDIIEVKKASIEGRYTDREGRSYIASTLNPKWLIPAKDAP